MTQQITLYTAEVEIALHEVNAKYTRYEIDIRNKPDWFTAEVNPVGQVPALTYGGPEVPPNQPSSESAKLRESIILLEFVADLFPETNMLPPDPILRAKARYFMDVFKTKVVTSWNGYFRWGEAAQSLFTALEGLQALLPPTGFVAGEFSIADVASVLFLVRMWLMLEHELLLFDAKEDEAKETIKALRQRHFERLERYTHDVMERPSFKGTFNRDALISVYKQWSADLRADKLQREKP
ncbi:hypothetical protein OBBRIDRAFT_814285 [Obba rivulosa]|uniref:GST N-terminal domain-containing protein n=1 Tax=Obba rivulosa TaxID=1052685 RepID=A0A8E2ARH4_9APHY|nr:hypothetical protein OBBRIDRAFT_814285 [Obba rivulosa]